MKEKKKQRKHGQGVACKACQKALQRLFIFAPYGQVGLNVVENTMKPKYSFFNEKTRILRMLRMSRHQKIKSGWLRTGAGFISSEIKSVSLTADGLLKIHFLDHTQEIKTSDLNLMETENVINFLEGKTYTKEDFQTDVDWLTGHDIDEVEARAFIKNLLRVNQNFSNADLELDELYELRDVWVKEVSKEDKPYAACNTKDCGKRADWELWNKAGRLDSRCEGCAMQMKWVDGSPNWIHDETKWYECKWGNCPHREKNGSL